MEAVERTGVRQRKGKGSKKAAKPAAQSVADGPKPEKEPNKLIENIITAGGWRRLAATANDELALHSCFPAHIHLDPHTPTEQPAANMLLLLTVVVGYYTSGGRRRQAAGDRHGSRHNRRRRGGADAGASLAHLPAGSRNRSVTLKQFAGASHLKQLPQFSREYESARLWGTYRPGYYFGACPRHTALACMPRRVGVSVEARVGPNLPRPHCCRRLGPRLGAAPTVAKGACLPHHPPVCPAAVVPCVSCVPCRHAHA